MNDMICDFYAKVDIDSEFVNRMIILSETSKPRKSIQKSVVFASACAAVLVIGVVAMLVFRAGGFLMGDNSYTYGNLARFTTAAGDDSDDLLISHDGFALFVEGAYFNGSQMYVAVKGEYDQWERDYASDPDTLKYHIKPDDGSCFMVNGQDVECVSREITLVKNHKYFEGVVQLNVNMDESIVYLKMSLPALDVYSGDSYIKSVYGSFDMENIINRTYTMNEENVLNGNDEIYIEQIVYFRGINIQYVVPTSIVNVSDTDIGICAYNEDGSEIALYSEEKRMGNKRYVLFVNPKNRHIRVVLYKTDGLNTTPIQEYEVMLNAPNRFHAGNMND